ncbi:MAG: membrane-bound lytic murein transglycosylase MltF [Iodobacter sp.]
MKHWLMALATVVLTGCGEMPEQTSNRVLPWAESQELVVLVQNGPTTLYVDAEGNYAGLEYDLVTRFALANGLKVRFIVTSSYAELLSRLKAHEAHFAVGMQKGFEGSGLAFGPSYQNIEPVLVYPSKKPAANVLAELSSGQGRISTLPQYVMALNQLKAKKPALSWDVVEDGDSEDLIERVANGQLSYAMVDSQAAEVAQNYFPKVAISREMGSLQQLAWAAPEDDSELFELFQSFFSKISKNGELRSLLDRYYGHVNRLGPLDAMAFLDKRKSTLPRYKRWFREAGDKTGLDWRLVAALSYQESMWDPEAVSMSGVRGMMMLTNDTAERLGVNRLDPYQSIQGGARYIQTMKDSLAENIAEPDRTWLALAAYNVGLGHLLDARALAVKLGKNPDSWVDVKTTLPLLRNPQYFKSAKYGYARGGEPVIFVERLRTYYDILVRFESPAQSNLPVLSENIVVQNPNNLPLNINNRVLAAAIPVRTAAL